MGSSLYTLKVFWKATIRYRWLVLVCVATTPLGYAAMSIWFPYLIGQIADQLMADVSSNSGSSGALSPQLKQLIFVAGVAKAAEICLLRAGDFSWVHLQARVMRDLAKNANSRVLSLSYTFHKDNFAGALLKATTRYVDNYEIVADTIYFEFSFLAVISVGIVAVLLSKSLILGVAVLIWLVLYALFVYLKLKTMFPLQLDDSQADSETTAVFVDQLTNVSQIKYAAQTPEEIDRYGEAEDLRFRARSKWWVTAVWFRMAQNVMLTVLDLGLMLLVAWLALRGAITIGDIATSFIYALTLGKFLWDMSHIIEGFQSALAKANEFSLIDQANLDQPRELTTTATLRPASIEFDNVSFRYSDASVAAVSNVSFTVNPGEKIGIVGPSGGGKTTLTKLLLRVVDLTDGEIRIAGVPTDSISKRSLRSQIAYVAQEPLLFHRSIAENISYGVPSAMTEDVRRAAASANIAEFVDSLPEGYETLVGERGTKLSGGQRQRVAIARAAIKDASVLILDEATSSLDSESERLVLESFDRLMVGRTTLVVAHRLSTLRAMDRIIVVENAKVTGLGTHEELLVSNQTYGDLWSHQQAL